jgi:hypothetical protein
MSDSSRGGGTSYAIAWIASAAVFVLGWASVRLGIAFAIPVNIVALGAAAIILRGPLGAALARRLGGRNPEGLDESALRELEELRARMTELEQASGRMAELEERLDFAERLLVQHREKALRIDAEGKEL